MNLYLIEWTDNNYSFKEYPNNNYIRSYKQLELDDLSINEFEEIKKYGFFCKSNTIYIYDITKDWSSYGNIDLLLNAINMIKKAERDKKINILL